MHQYAVCWVDKKSQPEVQGECVSIAPFDCGFYRIVASIVAVRVRQDNVLRGGEWFEKLSDPANTSGPRTRFFRTVLTAAVAFCNQFSLENHLLDFFANKPVQIQDSLDQLRQNWQHQPRQNHRGDELLCGTTLNIVEIFFK